MALLALEKDCRVVLGAERGAGCGEAFVETAELVVAVAVDETDAAPAGGEGICPSPSSPVRRPRLHEGAGLGVDLPPVLPVTLDSERPHHAVR